VAGSAELTSLRLEESLALNLEPGTLNRLYNQESILGLLKELKHRLENLLGADGFEMILFGSRARGDYDDDSDIDVAIVVRGLTRERKLQILDEVAGFELDYLSPISALVLSEDDFSRLRQRERRIALDIERVGIPL
jgi:hypothetical protein